MQKVPTQTASRRAPRGAPSSPRSPVLTADVPEARRIPKPVADGLQCLREAAVPFALLHADTSGLDALPFLELHIDPTEHKIAFAALRRAGYREMEPRLRFGKAHVFLSYENARFFALVVRADFVQNGIRYLDAPLARSRFDVQGALPLLGPEDRFLHVLLSALIAGRELEPSEKGAMRRLRRDRIDAERLQRQTRALGLEKEIEGVVQDLDLYLSDAKPWKRLARRVRRALLRLPDNRRGAWRHWKANTLRLSYRPVVLAVLGPAGSGSTTFARALQKELERSPLNASCVAMGSWNGADRWSRVVRRLAPPRTAWGRLFRAACGRPTHLSESERQHLATRRPRVLGLALRAAWWGARNVCYYGLVTMTLALRYFRNVARSRTSVVVADGWIYDLGCPPRQLPYSYGARIRRALYQRFPMPDGILYVSNPYERAAAHAAHLEREPYEATHRNMRRLLESHQPLELISEGPPELMAQTFLRRYWAHVLHRHNLKA